MSGHGCNSKLAHGQWWHFCGETDMGQTLPALCEHCGGEYIRADDPDWKAKVAALNKAQAIRNEQLQQERKRTDWVSGDRGWKTVQIPYTGDGEPECKPINDALQQASEAIGYRPDLIVIKPSPTPAERLARRLREKIEPFSMGLTDDQSRALNQMIDAAAKHAEAFIKPDIEKILWKDAFK